MIPALAGCPSPVNEYLLEDYWPLSEGNSWEWTFTDATGTHQVSLTVEAKVLGYASPVWRCRGEGLDRVALALCEAGVPEALRATPQEGYLVVVDGAYYVAFEPGLLDVLPDTDGLWRIPIPSHLHPRVEFDGRGWTWFVPGSLSAFLPRGADDLDVFGVGEQEHCIGVTSAPDLCTRGAPELILGKRIGILFAGDASCQLLLQDAVIRPDKDECPLCDYLGE